MKRCIVHIGMPRTGSTSLQVLLDRNRQALAAAGILYPEILPRSAQNPSVNHQEFGETFDGRRPRHEREQCLQALSRELAASNADTVILSYEDFALQQPRFGVPQLLREVLQRHGFAMEVAIVVKAPSEYLNSTYSHRAQLVREKRTFREFARVTWRSQRFDYEGLIQPWLRAASGRVTAMPLRDRRSGAPLLERVLSGMELWERSRDLLDSAGLGRVENRSPGPVAVEASRRLRRLRAREQAKVPPREIGRFLDECAWSSGWDEASFRGDDPETLARVDAHFAPANERFARTVWGTAWDDVYQPAQPWRPNELGGSPIPPEVEERVEHLVGAAIARFGLKRPSRVRSALLDFATDVAVRSARFVGYRGWRID